MNFMVHVFQFLWHCFVFELSFLLLQFLDFIQRLTSKCHAKGRLIYIYIHTQTNGYLLVLGIDLSAIIVSFLYMNAIMVNFSYIVQQNKQKNLYNSIVFSKLVISSISEISLWTLGDVIYKSSSPRGLNNL